MAEKEPPLFLGLDLSTQQLKAVVLDSSMNIEHECSVSFDADLKQFCTEGGVIKHEDGVTFTAPTIMWVKAFDVLLVRLQNAVCLSRIVAISGCAQQHGSVYWKRGSKDILQNLNFKLTLEEQLKNCFAIDQSPIWMDCSTTKQCLKLEDCIGGAKNMAEITGSRAYERFTGNQILKMLETMSNAYELTERISLVSSFCATLFLGKYAEIDFSDGSGMNLMNLRTRMLERQLVKKAGGFTLEEKLGFVLVPSATNLGCISQYFVERFAFSPKCIVSAFTGDNPASLAGLSLKSGDIAISLGTSDTVFVWLDTPHPQLMGHIFVNPLDEAAFMGLLCYRNGALTRQKVCQECAKGDWDTFNEMLLSTPVGNNGLLGFFYEYPEITPKVIGLHFFQGGIRIESTKISPQQQIRALIEGQFITKYNHLKQLGYFVGSHSRILATGGASANQHILQILSNVFNAPVFVSKETTNSTCVGGAIIAASVYWKTKPSEIKTKSYEKLAALPVADLHEVYRKSFDVAFQLEQSLLNN